MGCITLISFTVAMCLTGVTYGITDCTVGGVSDDFVDQISRLRLCPIPILDEPDETYCCEDGCCNLTGFIFSGYRLIIALAVIAVLALISCCCICRRCNSGTVHVVQSSILGYRVMR